MYSLSRRCHRRVNEEFVSSPISKLPVELLSEIFSFCALLSGEPSSSAISSSTSSIFDANQDEPNHSPPVINSEMVRVPFILSRVNRRWREVAHGQSSLWSNLCITAELILGPDANKKSTLDTNHIALSLERSRRSALDILIDARDPNWDFSEAGVGQDDPESLPTPTLFSSQNMSIVMSLLVPHLSQWKSLTILTDTWEPMHTALSAINPALTSFGAPTLEALTLIRCNDFVSFSPQFQPQEMKAPLFLERFCPEASMQSGDVLPKLKYLSLRGVHVDWDSLAAALALGSASGGLRSMELASHCADVRPSKDQYRTLLSSVPALRRLVITGSGPSIPEDSIIDSVSLETSKFSDVLPVSLPNLESLSVGYRTTLEGRTVLELLDAPNVRTFVLEEASYPGDPEEINGGSLLTYVGSRRFIGNETAFRAAYPSPPPFALPQLVEVTDGASDNNDNDKRNSATGIRRRKSSASPQSEDYSNAAFPLLENVTLRNVKSTSEPLRTFFNALSSLRHLELVGMSMQSVNSLLPPPPSLSLGGPSSNAAACPCPQLETLCVKDSYGKLKDVELDFVMGDLASERERRGGKRMSEVDIHVDALRAARISSTAVASFGTKVRIISDDDGEDEGEDEDEEGNEYMDEDEDADEDYSMDTDVDPFKLGGAFNDPVFDQYYSAQMFASHNSH